VYEDYIREDLSCRVFVDYEVFMKQVLHVPGNWRTLWRQAIEAVTTDKGFTRQYERYCEMCGKANTAEKEFYSPLVEMANAVLEVVSQGKFKCIPSERRQYYCATDLTHLKGGVMDKKNLCPDIILMDQNRKRPSGPKDNFVYWANPLHVLEVKPHDSVLCDGANMPHLIVDGE